MKIHILGIGGTFMAGLALLARQQGHQVTGADQQLYSPMREQLAQANIEVVPNYATEQLKPNIEHIIVGNILSRGKHAVLEAMLNQPYIYSSGPAWIAANILPQRQVIAVAGTHGKTTTSSMLAWILDYAGLTPGFLIGGIPINFGVSARLGQGKPFVIEADEYDSAFFDKRPKFLHYTPQILILTNLEFDHADIFTDLAAIQTQFQYLLRIIPANGQIIMGQDNNLTAVLKHGCWTPVTTFGNATADWYYSTNKIYHHQQCHGLLQLALLGEHNRQNALAAIAGAYAIGVSPAISLAALQTFKGVKRRLEKLGEKNNVMLYEDFAHHPTAIAATLTGLRATHPQRLIVVVECASNTMRLGVHGEQLIASLDIADYVILKRPYPDWGIDKISTALNSSMPHFIASDVEAIVKHLLSLKKAGDTIVIMSNKNFDGLASKILKVW